jgi:hypothetical protein
MVEILENLSHYSNLSYQPAIESRYAHVRRVSKLNRKYV